MEPLGPDGEWLNIEKGLRGSKAVAAADLLILWPQVGHTCIDIVPPYRRVAISYVLVTCGVDDSYDSTFLTSNSCE